MFLFSRHLIKFVSSLYTTLHSSRSLQPSTPTMYLRNTPSTTISTCHQASAAPQRGGMPSVASLRTAAQASTGTADAPLNKDRPDWTGQSTLSTAVNFFTRIPVVKQMAKNLFKDSMRKQGVDWDAFVRAADAARPQLQALKTQLENPAVQYPAYYLKDFHSYDTGNLSWLAASVRAWLW